MRNPINFKTVLISSLFLLMQNSVLAESVGKVISASGSVTIGGSAASRGSSLSTGQVVKTGADSTAQLRFSDGTLVSVQPDSSYRVDAYKFNKKGNEGNEQKATLQKGGITSITGETGKRDPQNYELKTPVATIGVRGTAFTVKALRDKSMVGVWDGTVNATPVANRANPNPKATTASSSDSKRFISVNASKDGKPAEVTTSSQPPAGLSYAPGGGGSGSSSSGSADTSSGTQSSSSSSDSSSDSQSSSNDSQFSSMESEAELVQQNQSSLDGLSSSPILISTTSDLITQLQPTPATTQIGYYGMAWHNLSNMQFVDLFAGYLRSGNDINNPVMATAPFLPTLYDYASGTTLASPPLFSVGSGYDLVTVSTWTGGLVNCSFGCDYKTDPITLDIWVTGVPSLGLTGALPTSGTVVYNNPAISVGINSSDRNTVINPSVNANFAVTFGQLGGVIEGTNISISDSIGVWSVDPVEAKFDRSSPELYFYDKASGSPGFDSSGFFVANIKGSFFDTSYNVTESFTGGLMLGFFAGNLNGAPSSMPINYAFATSLNALHGIVVMQR